MQERLNSIPIHYRIAAAGVVVLLLFLVVYFTTMQGDGRVELTTTDEQSMTEATRWKLDQEGIKYQMIEQDNGAMLFRVKEADKPKARVALNMSNGVNADAEKACKETGALSVSAERRAAELCGRERAIEQNLIAREGILAAYVTLTEEESGSLLSDTPESSAAIQLYLDPVRGRSVNGPDLASFISAQHQGLDTSNVKIHTMDNRVLYDPEAQVGAPAAPESTGQSCNSMPEEPTVMQVQACMAEQIEAKVINRIATMIGPGKAMVFANPILTTRVENTTDTTLNGGTDNPTGSSETISQSMPGELESLRLSVILNDVTPAQENAVRTALTTAYDVRPDDEISVTTGTFPGAGTSSATDGEKTDGATGAGDPEPGSGADMNDDLTTTPETAIPRSLIVGGFLVLVGMLTVMALLWRRGARLAAERKKFEEEFQHDMRRYQTVAQSDPDALADEISSWLSTQNQRTTN